MACAPDNSSIFPGYSLDKHSCKTRRKVRSATADCLPTDECGQPHSMNAVQPSINDHSWLRQNTFCCLSYVPRAIYGLNQTSKVIDKLLIYFLFYLMWIHFLKFDFVGCLCNSSFSHMFWMLILSFPLGCIFNFFPLSIPGFPFNCLGIFELFHLASWGHLVRIRSQVDD